MSVRDDVIAAVRGKLAGAEDNMYRFGMQFCYYTRGEMEREYGRSGRKCSDVLKGAEDDVRRWKAALDSLQ